MCKCMCGLMLFSVCPSRHQSTGSVIGRCGQPEVSWWGWRNAEDEQLVQAIAKACSSNGNALTPLSNGSCGHAHTNGTNGNAGLYLHRNALSLHVCASLCVGKDEFTV